MDDPAGNDPGRLERILRHDHSDNVRCLRGDDGDSFNQTPAGADGNGVRRDLLSVPWDDQCTVLGWSAARYGRHCGGDRMRCYVGDSARSRR